MNIIVDNGLRSVYNEGWQADGSWHCPKCGTTIGKNLLNQQPFVLAWQHIKRCNGVPGNQFKKVEDNYGPFPLKVRY